MTLTINPEFENSVVHAVLSRSDDPERNHMCCIGESKLTGAGLGLFAKRLIRCGTVVCVYSGDVLRTTEAMRLEDKSYLMRLGCQCYVDARCHLSTIARYINDCRNQHCYNVRFFKCPSERCAYVIATRDIACGEELYVDYGRWYWVGKKPSRLLYVPS